MDFSVCRDDSSNSDINISAALPRLGLRHGRSDRTAIGFAKIADLSLRWRGEHVFARVRELRHGLRNLQLANAGKRVGNLGRHKLARKRKELTVFDELVTDLFQNQCSIVGIDAKLIVLDLLASDGVEFNASNLFPDCGFIHERMDYIVVSESQQINWGQPHDGINLSRRQFAASHRRQVSTGPNIE